MTSLSPFPVDPKILERIRPMKPEDSPDVARLHASSMGHSLWAELGEKFLIVLYKALLEHPDFLGFVYVEDGRLRGFIAGSSDAPRLLRDVRRRSGVRLSLAALAGAIRRPGAAILLMQTFRYFSTSRPLQPDEDSRAESFFCSFDPELRGTRISGLINKVLFDELAARGMRSVTISTEAGNEGAVRQLTSWGFERRGTFRFYGKEMISWRLDFKSCERVSPKSRVRPDKRILETKGACPICLETVPGVVVEGDDAVFLEKTCPSHGNHRTMLSRHPDYYFSLLDYFRAVRPKSDPQRDYILRLTNRCNLQCPICLASSDQYEERDLTLDDVRSFLRGRRKLKLDLMGAEPTMHGGLETIIRTAKAEGHITALHTNGIRLGEEGYLERLSRAGLDEVHLQFDGMDESHDEILRGKAMGAVKIRALDAIARAGLPVDLVVTILRGTNEKSMGEALNLAAARPEVKEVFFLGCRRLGRATDGFAQNAMVPDELIDLIEEQTEGAIRRDDIRIFQKLYFAFLAIFRVRKCFYIHHYIVRRHHGGCRPISRDLDLAYLEPHLDRFRRLYPRRPSAATLDLLFHVAAAVIRRKGFGLVLDGIVLQALLRFGFNLSKIPRRIVLLGFITACDPWIYDEGIAEHCGKGEVSTDLGVHEAGADANVARERLHRLAPVTGGGKRG